MKRLLMLTALALSAGASAQTAAPKADLAAVLERGKQIASQVCAACHGPDGNSPTAANPSIAGQHADYITVQLMHFKEGVRVSPIMQPMAAALSPDDMRAVAAFYARQAPRGLASRDPKLVQAGQQMWRGGDAARGIPACSACHGPSGAGMPKNYPRVAGQHAEYTLAQLRAFQTGERGRDKRGKDSNGALMATIAKSLTDHEIRALADYAAGLR